MIDIKGKRFGRFKVLSSAGVDSRGESIWKCICNCGKIKFILSYALRKGKIKSCGCYQKFIRGKSSRTHNASQSRLYHIWTDIFTRCYNKNCAAYKNYGGRGIKICKRWHDFSMFKKDIGRRPSKYFTIERINNNKGYSPKNCKWLHKSLQHHNKRTSHYLTFEGKRQCIGAWAKELNWPNYIIVNRLRYGWPVKKILTTPIRK